MSIQVTMPALSPTMEAGTLARWLVKEGDVVSAGALLAEVETDKATMELEAAEGGVITRLLVAEGTEDVRVGAPVALMEAGDVAASPPATAPPPSSAPVAPAAVAPALVAPLAAPKVVPPQAAEPAPPSDRIAAEPPPGVKASPLARRMARVAGVDLSGVKGTGPRGKIVAADVGLPVLHEAPALHPALDGSAAPVPAALAWVETPPPAAPHRAVKLSGMRKTIARRLTEAKQSVPHFYLSMDIRMDGLFAFRAEVNAASGEAGVKVSVNDLMIKALATALEDTPDANVQFAGDRLLMFERVDVSMAVAVPGGLVTPVILDAGGKRLTRIAAEAKALAERARDGKLAPEDYEGGTVSISNLGMFGVTQMTPVINPPQALILGVAAAAERAWSQGGQIVSAKVMTATASFDHRAIDGATGAAFLARFKHLVEHPLTVLA